MSMRVHGQILEHLNKDGIINHQGSSFNVLGWITLKMLLVSLFCKVQLPGPVIMVFLQETIFLESQIQVVLSLFCQIGPGDQGIDPQVLGSTAKFTLMGYTPFNLQVLMVHLPITSQALHWVSKEMKLAAVHMRCLLISVWVKCYKLLIIHTVASLGWLSMVMEDNTWNWTSLRVIILLFRMCTGLFDCPPLRLWWQCVRLFCSLSSLIS